MARRFAKGLITRVINKARQIMKDNSTVIRGLAVSQAVKELFPRLSDSDDLVREAISVMWRKDQGEEDGELPETAQEILKGAWQAETRHGPRAR